jgi:hypothetical protein
VRGAGARQPSASQFGTSIAPIYARTVAIRAERRLPARGLRWPLPFGIGVSHAPAHVRMGVTPGKPLGDITTFVQKLRAHDASGALPPVYLATSAQGHDRAAGEIATAWCSPTGARSHMADSLAALPAAKRATRFLHRQHDPDLHQRRRRGSQGVNRKTLTTTPAAELPQLLEGSGLRRGDEAIETASPRSAWRRAQVLLPTPGLPTAPCSAPLPRARGARGLVRRRHTHPHRGALLALGNQMKAIEEMFATFTG